MASRLQDLTAKLYRSPVSRNAGWLYILQASRYLFPLITVPYLVRVLGPANYGVVAFGQGLIAYLTAIVNYGFEWSVTRKIAAAPLDLDRVGLVASTVWTAKAMLAGCAFLVLWLLIVSVARLHALSLLLLILSGTIVGNTLFPGWLFLGLEQMATITEINVSARFLGTVAVFVFVRHRGDVLVYAAILGFQSVFLGAAGVWYALRRLSLRFQVPPLNTVLSELRDGAALFLSTGAISLYVAGNSFILGLLAGNTEVGYFSAAEKLVRILVSAYDPISQSVFPRFSKLASNSKQATMLWAARLLKFSAALGFAISMGIFLGARPMVTVLLGSAFHPSINVIRVLAALPLLIAVSNVLGVQIMIPFRHDKIIAFIVASAAVLNLVLALVLVPRFGAAGMATAVLISETFVTVGYFGFVSHAGLNPLRGGSVNSFTT